MGLSLDQAFTLPPFKKGEIERLLERGKANESHLITQPLSGWCRDYHVSAKIVQQRLEAGMDIEEALSIAQADTLEINGKRTTLNSFCARFGVDAVAVKKCVQGGMGILEAMDYVAFSQKVSNKAPINGNAFFALRNIPYIFWSMGSGWLQRRNAKRWRSCWATLRSGVIWKWRVQDAEN